MPTRPFRKGCTKPPGCSPSSRFPQPCRTGPSGAANSRRHHEHTIPEPSWDLGYTARHVWARKDGDTLVIGITDFAQDQLGEILFVDLPDAGASFGADDEFGTVESLKTVSSLYMPVAGEVVERNEALEGKPTLVNLNCYADGWMLRIRPTETPALMTAAAYRSQLEG